MGSKRENNRQFVAEAKNLLAESLIEQIVQKTGGLSHAEIKDMVEAMRKKAFATKSGMITEKHIKDAADQAIEKHTVLETEKSAREATAAHQPA